jgi:threonine dehydratase
VRVFEKLRQFKRLLLRHDADLTTGLIMFSLTELQDATTLVHAVFGGTPQYAWPLLRQRTGADVWIKHENHTPAGAFKVRGGLTYFDRLKRENPDVKGVVSATRGNHGQSIAFAGGRYGVPVVIVVPRGNSLEKNAAMRAFGAELIEYGTDFDEAKVRAAEVAKERGYLFVPSFHPALVVGVATYAYELFSAVPDIDTVYVPIGLGSGICGVIRARDVMGLSTRVVGVVSENAAAYALSFAQGRVVETNSARTFADGMAVRVPSPEALEIIRAGADRIIQVSDDEVAEAIRALYADTHNLAEGAGAAPLAGLMQEKDRLQGRRVAAILCGGNIDASVFAEVIAGRTPQVA